MRDAIVELESPPAGSSRSRARRIVESTVAIAATLALAWSLGRASPRAPAYVAPAPSATPLACHPERVIVVGAADDNPYVSAAPTPVWWVPDAVCVIRSGH